GTPSPSCPGPASRPTPTPLLGADAISRPGSEAGGHPVFRYGTPSVGGRPLAQGPMYATLLATNAATCLACALCRIPLGIRPPTPCSIAFSTLEEFPCTVSALFGPVASNWSRFGPIWPSVPAAA